MKGTTTGETRAPHRPLPLPVDPLLPEVVAALRASAAVVIEAPPGAGKTTRVPAALLEAGFAAEGEIIVLQPRRLPARLAAARVAEERGERVGESVGYTVRFEDVSGPHTRIRFVTEGLLLRRLMAEPTLPGIAAVILDEFHERHVTTDVALALLRRLQQGPRPELKVCVMSATLDAEPIAAYLGGCPRLRSEGRRFEVTIDYSLAATTPREAEQRRLETQVVGAVRRALTEQPQGDVLVFLPGLGEIRRCGEALEPFARASELLVLPLHGDLPLNEQARAVAPASQRKVILSTNVAETSVTIDGVTAVIDTGLARIAGHSPWTGLPTLTLAKISQASAAQRAGRAGRTRPGTAWRLYARSDHDGRPRHDTPEIARSDLAEVVLALAALGVSDPATFPWLTPPPPLALAGASELLRRLGATDGSGALTDHGRRMARFPAHPRLGRVMVEGQDRGVVEDAAVAVALLGERDVRARGDGRDAGIDLIALLELFEQARAARFARDRLRSLGLDPRATALAEQARRQVLGLAEGRRSTASAGTDRLAKDRALARAVLAGFPDRVARRRAAPSRTVVFSAGGTAELGYEADSEFLVALDATERARSGGGPGHGGGGTTVRLGCGIDPDWLGDLDGGDLTATETLEFDGATERVVRRSRLNYGALVLDEAAPPAEPSDEVSSVLATAAIAHGVEAFDETGGLDRLRGRLEVVRQVAPALVVPALDGESFREALVVACQGLRSFSELREVGLASRIESAFPPDLRARLAAAAPPSVTLPGGRSLAVHYQPDRPPWIESRLQDFFGLARTPVIGGGQVPLTLHLLAPNGRAVQVTRDLENFWRQHYPPLRRELGRRYPRHPWPEDGSTATPPAPGPRRPQR